MIQFTITAGNGDFLLEGKSSFADPLELIISCVGYYQRKIRIENSTPSALVKNLDKVMLRQNVDRLEEVTIERPPVVYNHDTLEFNADAFKLEKNAVVEDLLQKLPGVTVWSDGEITVNGKKVSAVYVNGRQFFTGDAAVATQNIDKKNVSKVQVYQQLAEPGRNSVTAMNLVLKKGKDEGYFGKVGGGIGTHNTYDVSTIASFYRKNLRQQFSIGGIANNINKSTGGFASMLTSTTFKNNNLHGLDVDLQMAGKNDNKQAGFFYKEDFTTPKPATESKQSLNEVTATGLYSNKHQQRQAFTESANLSGEKRIVRENQSRSRSVINMAEGSAGYKFFNKMTIPVKNKTIANKQNSSISPPDLLFVSLNR